MNNAYFRKPRLQQLHVTEGVIPRHLGCLPVHNMVSDRIGFVGKEIAIDINNKFSSRP